jgi:hypothetical protein
MLVLSMVTSILTLSKLLLMMVMLCISLKPLDDGLRDAFDPRQRRRLSKKDKANARQMQSRSELA